MINGISQKFGQDYKATNTVCNEKNRFFSTDIAAAYPACLLYTSRSVNGMASTIMYMPGTSVTVNLIVLP